MLSKDGNIPPLMTNDDKTYYGRRFVTDFMLMFYPMKVFGVNVGTDEASKHVAALLDSLGSYIAEARGSLEYIDPIGTVMGNFITLNHLCDATEEVTFTKDLSKYLSETLVRCLMRNRIHFTIHMQRYYGGAKLNEFLLKDDEANNKVAEEIYGVMGGLSGGVSVTTYEDVQYCLKLISDICRSYISLVEEYRLASIDQVEGKRVIH